MYTLSKLCGSLDNTMKYKISIITHLLKVFYTITNFSLSTSLAKVLEVTVSFWLLLLPSLFSILL